MPDVAARASLLSRRLAGSALTEAEIHEIATRTEGFNCSDLNVFINDSTRTESPLFGISKRKSKGLMEAVREMDQATHWRVIDDPAEKGVAWTPCAASFPHSIEW